MLLKLLGVLDLIVAFIVFVNAYFFRLFSFPDIFIICAGTYLLIKGILFALVLDFTSFIDIAAGIIILLTLSLTVPHLIMAIVFIYLLQKGIISLVS
jgi:hypothetical protein